MTEKPLVTFIICTYNRADYLDDTLHSLLNHPVPDDFQFEILVVDNNSSDRTPDIIQQYQDTTSKDDKPIRYIKETKQGLSHARNRGIQESHAPYVVFLDDDIRATPSLIPAWVSFFDKNPKAVAAGGRIRVQFDAPRPDWMSHFLLPLLGHHDLGKARKEYPTNKYPFGGNMGFKKTIFDEVGDFDIALGRKGKSLYAGEEKELFRRIRSTSHDIYYLPDAFVYHRVNEDRLTIEHIRKQALGLGQSMRLQLDQASSLKITTNWISEVAKFCISFPLGLGYVISLQPSKAKLLLKFRWWIWEGYRQARQ